MPYSKEEVERRSELVAEGEIGGYGTAVYLYEMTLGGNSFGWSLSPYIIDAEGGYHLMGSALGHERDKMIAQAKEMAKSAEAEGIYDCAFPCEAFPELCEGRHGSRKADV